MIRQSECSLGHVHGRKMDMVFSLSSPLLVLSHPRVALPSLAVKPLQSSQKNEGQVSLLMTGLSLCNQSFILCLFVAC